MLQVALFFVAIMAPFAAFGFYVMYAKRWKFRRLIPYGIVYQGVIGAIMAWALGFHGWDFVFGFGLAFLAIVIAWFSWAKLVDSVAEPKQR